MKKTLLVMFTLAFCTSAFAKEGLVIGLGAGKGELKLDEGSNFSNADKDDEDNTRNALIGYRVGDALSFELGYHDLGEFEISNGLSTLSGETESVSLSALLGLPLTRHFSIFGRAGFHHWTVDTASNAFGPRERDEADGTDVMYGAGVRGELTESFAIRLQYDKLKLSDEEDDADIGDYDVASVVFEMTL
ncbi:opacity protein-like surface antigen [Litorivivens lipolytica]|uniref:Opacity protein-like surface antigen n=1 Tax=Litorivivens lipolytica TaxID=1524264 RepID=A0A7W4W2D7_9GAMM|nr:outer membrane beta-barrel protein [Litorivivens lipolytica]MBB3046177.1 opacity protein-like surface antigen [Litorivivens lipolytica]